MSTVITEQNVYGAQFSTKGERLPGSHWPWVERLRQKGMDDFLALGFPTTKLENWKYTNVAPIRRVTFAPATVAAVYDRRGSAGETSPAVIDPSPRLVFVNGWFAPALSSITVGAVCDRAVTDRAHSSNDGSSIHLLNISEALRDPERASVIERHLGRYTSTADHAFAAWNSALFTDGAYIEVPRGFVFEQPIHLVFVSAGMSEPWACHPRNLIVVGESSQITFVESFLGSTDQVYFTNAVTEIAACSGAVIDYYKIEREAPQSFHVAVINAHLDSD